MGNHNWTQRQRTGNEENENKAQHPTQPSAQSRENQRVPNHSLNLEKIKEYPTTPTRQITTRNPNFRQKYRNRITGPRILCHLKQHKSRTLVIMELSEFPFYQGIN
ncbi:hypothetical protein ACH3XW_33510 [Acanthocheilonema viteae]